MKDDLTDLFSPLIEVSKQINSNNPHNKKKRDGWLECIELYNDGWKCTACEEIENSSHLIFVWKKENQSKKIRLSFTEQRLWFEYLEKRAGVKDE